MENFTFRHKEDCLEAFFTKVLQVYAFLLFSLFIVATSQAQVRQIQINPRVDTASLPSSGTEISEEGVGGISEYSIKFVDGSRLLSPSLWNADMGGVNLFRLPEPWIHDPVPFPHHALIGPVWNLGMSRLSNEAADQENTGGQFSNLPGATHRAQDAVTILEGNQKIYNVSLDTQPSSDVTVTITVGAGAKLTVNPTTLTFSVGDWDTPEPITLTAVEDDDSSIDIVELTLANSGGDTSSKQVTVTIVDDEIIWELTPMSIEEGQWKNFRVGLLEALGRPSGDVTIKVTGHENTDAIPDPTTLKFLASDWPQRIKAMSMTTKLDEDEEDEQVTLIFTATGGGYDGLKYSMDVRIQDRPPFEEEPIPEGESTIMSYRLVAEGGQLGLYTAFDMIATLSGHEGTDLTVDPVSWIFRHESWIQCEDGRGYCNVTPKIKVTAAHDPDDEDDLEDLIMTATSPVINLSARTRIRVLDDDDPGLVVSESRLTIPEGGAETFRVRLSEPPLGDFGSNGVTVSVPSPGDLTAKPSSLTFTSETWDTEQTVRLTAGHDDDVEDDFEELWLAASGGGYDLERARVLVEIIDDDDIIVSFEEDKNAPEDIGYIYVVMTISPVPSSDTSLNTAGTAVRGDDYRISDATQREVGNSMEIDIQLQIIDDSLEEPDETVILSIDPQDGYDVTDTHTLTIIDNDAPPAPEVSFALQESSAPEDKGTHEVVVNLSPAPASDISVTYSLGGDATQGADADYTVSGTTIQVAANTASVKIPVTIIDDKEDELDETVVFTIAPGTGYTVGTPNPHTLTIVDNDVPAVSFALQKSSASEDKGTHEVVVNLSPAPASDISVTYSLGGDATQGADADYTVSGTTIQVDANIASVQIPVTIIDDKEDELDETVVFTIDSGTGYTVGSPNPHTLTINDNDVPVVSFDKRESRVHENAVTHNVRVNISPAPVSELRVVLAYVPGPGVPATQRDDYNFPPVLRVPAKSSWVNLPVTILDDKEDEPDEELTIAIPTPHPILMLATRPPPRSPTH